jgi:cation diffusion facilitator family transporter
MAIKFVAYALTASSAVFSDALESIVNVLAGAFALYAIVLAHRPADETHPYGHGKVEFLAAGFEGGMILLAAMVIVWRGVEALVFGPGIHRVDVGLALMTVATLVNGAVGLGLLRYARRHGSITLEADGRHLLTDAVTSVAVLAALLAVRVTGLAWIDPACALLVSAYLAVTGVRLLRRSAAGLMDEQDLEDDALIRRILDEHVGRINRHTGRYHWVDFHMMVPRDWDVGRGHEAASVIEGEIEQALGVGDATAHVEPCPGCACCAA